MKAVLGALVIAALSLGGCRSSGLEPEIGARELRPPQTGIFVGSLYYAAEEPTQKLDGPVALESLCQIKDLSSLGIDEPTPGTLDSINIIDRLKLDASGGGLRGVLAGVGLSGNFSDYYEYKIINITKYSIPATDADLVAQKLLGTKRCRDSVADRNDIYAIYQVKAAYVGDIVFSRRRDLGADASLNAKLSRIQPKLALALKSEYGVAISGRGVVFGFVPIVRNSSGS